MNTKDPQAFGKGLKGNLKEYWRYPVGTYRISADIDNDEIKIYFNVGHRKDIYS